MKKGSIFIVTLLLIALVVSACAPAPTPTPTPKPVPKGPIKVGMMTVMTGPAASVGMEQRNWAKLAVDQFNEAGGVAGIKVEMLEGDTEFDPAKAVLVAERMAADPAVYGIVGPESSQNCAATADIFGKVSLAFISPSCTRSDLTEKGYKTFFRVVPRDDVQAPADAIFMAKDLGVKSVYIIDDQSSYSVGIADEATKKLQELGVAKIKRESITQKDSDFSALLTRVKAEAPDAIFIPIQLAAQGAQIAKQMRELGVKAHLVGSDGLFSPSDFIAGAEGATEGAYVSQFAPDVHYIPEAESAWKAYEAQYGEFGAYGPPAYESMAVLLDAIKRAFEKDGQITRENVLREVKATQDRPGILGFKVTFNDKGDAIGASFYIFKVVKDHFELVKKVEM
jgi:branched-chain amino acid transport system substrate-binding protein